MDVPMPTTFPTYDRIVPGGLEQLLRTARDDGASLRTIVTRLSIEHDITVSVETVRNWCLKLGIETTRRAS